MKKGASLFYNPVQLIQINGRCGGLMASALGQILAAVIMLCQKRCALY